MMQLTRPVQAAPASKWLVLIATSLGVFMGSLDVTIANVAFPSIERSFSGTSQAALSWVLNAYTIAFAALLIVFGRTADRIGRKRVFFAGLAVFTAGSIICGLAPTVTMLVAGRVIQGVGAAAMIPASLGLLLAGFPSSQRAAAVSLWGVFSALATATGPTLGAALVEGPGWRWAFFINVPVAIVAWVLGSRVLRESRDESAHGGTDVGGVALITVGMATLALGVVEGGEWGWTSPRVLLAFAAAAIAISVFVWRGLRTASPVVDLRLFGTRSFAVANLVMVIYASAFFAILLSQLLFLTSVWHYSTLRAGLAITPSPIAAALMAPLAGRAVSRLGFRPIIATGLTITSVSVAWLYARTGTHPGYLEVWLPGSIILGVGAGICFAQISGAAVSSLGPAQFGVGSAVNQTARQIGSIVGVAAVIAILGTPATPAVAVDHFHNAWLFVTALTLAAATVSLALGGHKVAVATPTPALIEEPLPDAAA